MRRFLTRSRIYFLAVLTVALAFFVATSYYNFTTQKRGEVKWNSPDETANYFFAYRLATGETISKFEKANVVAQDLVMPRSMRSDGGWLKPVSFLGMIFLYGKLGTLITPDIIPYLTPFFGALGIIFFFLFTKRFFSQRVAFISAVLLAIFPVYFYYTLRSMFHNVLFLVMIIIGAYFLTLALDKRYQLNRQDRFLTKKISKITAQGWLLTALAGYFFGWAIVVRTSELVWLMPVLFLILLFYGRRAGIVKVILFLGAMWLAALPVLFYNQWLYGSPFFGGYNEMNRSLEAISGAGSTLITQAQESLGAALWSFGSKMKNTIFFFGYKPDQSWEMFNHYVVAMFPWLAVFTPLGLLTLLILNLKKPARKYLVYVLSWLLLSIILVLYYGSWRFTDNPNADSHTIGNSYTRYWLPMYLLAFPLVALAWDFLARAFFQFARKFKIYRLLVSGALALATVALTFHSFNFLLFSSEEGLASLYFNMSENRRLGRLVFEHTPSNAIIMTQYHDKVLFPERSIIMGLMHEAPYYPFLQKLENYYPIYYFNFTYPEADLNYLNSRRLPEYGLQLKPVKFITRQFTLYQIIKLEEHE